MMGGIQMMICVWHACVRGQEGDGCADEWRMNTPRFSNSTRFLTLRIKKGREGSLGARSLSLLTKKRRLYAVLRPLSLQPRKNNK